MQNLSVNRPTWAEIDLDNLAFNFHSVKEFVGPGIEQMAVVKADAYGHGAVECARRLEAVGADWLAVATTEEAVELRQGGVLLPILVFGSFWPGQEREVLNFDLTPILIREGQADALNEAAESRSPMAKVHVKVDTGMNRVGFRQEHWRSVAKHLFDLKNIQVEGLMTHFAAAENLSENAFTGHQIARFAEAVEIFHEAGHRPKYIDMANSPGAVIHPLSKSKMVRIGGLLFGLADDVIPKGVEKPEVKPVMALYSRIALVKSVPKGETIGYGRTFETERDSVIATIPVGYSDGFRRGLSNKGKVIVNGKLAPIAGRLSMDWTTVDVTDCGNVAVGDKVTLIGMDQREKVAAVDLAEQCETLSYEITCGISSRVPRIYSGKVL
jgi:alanine racemase